jgi:hypothetical protein
MNFAYHKAIFDTTQLPKIDNENLIRVVWFLERR